MNKNCKYSKNIFWILIIFIITIPVIIYFVNSNANVNINANNFRESFDNQTTNGIGMLFQTGTSDITQTGSIKFNQPFPKVPMIFTQINGSTNVANNVYGIVIFNITQQGFDYSKNKVSNTILNTENVQNMTVIKLESSTLETFNWIAFG